MRPLLLLLAVFSTVLCCSIRAEDAAELEANGIAALKASQTKSEAIVPAAAYFGKASAAYEQAGNDAKATEMNSFLYWCKKKMTLAQTESFLKENEASAPALAKRLKEIERTPAPAGEAQAYFDRADAYATAHPDQNFLIAIRFFEVADRFRGTDASLKALERSLKAQQLSLAESERKAASPEPASPAPSPSPAPVIPKSPAAAPARVAIPSAAEIKDSEKTVKELFKAQYQKNAPEDRSALAREMLKSGRDTQDDLPGKFVLLREAKDISALAGDIATALEAIDALDAQFAIDSVQMKTEALGRASAAAARPETRLAVAQAYVNVIDALLAADKYDAGAKLFLPAEAAARRVADTAALQACLQRVKDARDQHAESARVRKEMETLAANPDDLNANFVVGRFYCLVKDNWADGLAKLNKGSDAAYKEAAAGDLNKPQAAEDNARVADLWWTLAEKEKSKSAQMRLQAHAKSFYENAVLAAPTGLMLAKAWSRIKDVQGKLAEASKPGSPKLLDRTFTDKLITATPHFHNRQFRDKRFIAANKGQEVISHMQGGMELGEEVWGKPSVFCIHPASGKTPTILDFSAITQNIEGILTISFHNFPTGDCEVDIEKEGKIEKTIKVGGDVWKTEKIVFQRQPVKCINRATGWWNEHAYVTYEIELK